MRVSAEVPGAARLARPGLLILTLAVLIPIATPARAAQGPWAAEELTRLEAQLAWWLPLPLNFTVSITDYQLLDGVVYAIGSDGDVRAIRADNGQFLWIAEIGGHAERIFRGIRYNDPERPTVVFGRLTEQVMLDARNGNEIRRVPLDVAIAAAPAFGDGVMFVPSVNRQLICYDIEHDLPIWRVRTNAPMFVPPFYSAADNLLIFIDDSGAIWACDEKKQEVFRRELNASPRGHMALDGRALVIATSGDVSFLHAIDATTGEPLREPYRLAGKPQGGPIITEHGLYQSLLFGGLHRIGRDGSSWFLPEARLFLAEWPGRVVVLRKDGRIEWVDTQTGESLGILEGYRFRHGVSNPHNDVVVVATERGEMRALRPAGAPPVDPKTFIPATQPALAQPADDEPAPEPDAQPSTVNPPAPRPPARPIAGALRPPPPPPAPAAAPPAERPGGGNLFRALAREAVGAARRQNEAAVNDALGGPRPPRPSR